MNTDFDQLVSRLQANHDGNLVSVIAYGSAIAGHGKPKKSDYQLLIVTQCLTAAELRRIRPIIQWWAGAGYSLPIFFTIKEFNDSLDVYPIEFRHMKQAYRVLHGLDLLASKEPSKAHLRWQTELELRGKLVRLRSLYLPASLTTSDLLKLMTESVVSFVRFMRPVLELLGEEPPVGRLATVQRVGERLSIDTAPLVRILHLRDEPVRLMEAEAQDLFASYLDCLTQVIEAVNNM